MEEYQICTKCDIHHYENCHTCFGFGLSLDNIPIAAVEASSGVRSIKCPECGSTAKGLPSESDMT